MPFFLIDIKSYINIILPLHNKKSQHIFNKWIKKITEYIAFHKHIINWREILDNWLQMNNKSQLLKQNDQKSVRIELPKDLRHIQCLRNRQKINPIKQCRWQIILSIIIFLKQIFRVCEKLSEIIEYQNYNEENKNLLI